MLKRIREMKDEDGFTLIELMVVVLIIAILIAIAIPTFLGLRARAQDRAAQSDLRNALTAAKAYYTDSDSYTGFTADAAGTTNDGEGIEPALTWNTSATSVEGEVSVRAVTDSTVLLSTRSASTAIFCIADNAAPGGSGTTQGTGEQTTVAGCTGGW